MKFNRFTIEELDILATNTLKDCVELIPNRRHSTIRRKIKEVQGWVKIPGLFEIKKEIIKLEQQKVDFKKKIAKEIGVSYRSLTAKLRSNGNNHWTADELQELCIYFPIKGYDTVIGSRSKQAIIRKAMELKLTKPKADWTDEEIFILKRDYPTKGTFINLKGRSRTSIRAMAQRFNLKYTAYSTIWSSEEIELLKKMYPKNGYKTVIPGRSKSAMIRKKKELKLKVNR